MTEWKDTQGRAGRLSSSHVVRFHTANITREGKISYDYKTIKKSPWRKRPPHTDRWRNWYATTNQRDSQTNMMCKAMYVVYAGSSPALST